jgi:hypothetical protein
VTIDASASCTGTVTAAMLDAGSSDPDGTPVTATLAHPSSLRLGVNEVELIVSDGTLSSTCWSNVTLRDTTPPALTLPPTVNLKTCTYPATVSVGQATATDACGAPLVTGRVIATNGVTLATPIPVNAGSVSLPPGTYTVEWAASDGPNTTRANQTVTVSPLIESSSSFLIDDRAQLKAASGGFGAVFNAGSGSTRIGNDARSAGVLSSGPVDVLHRALVDGGITGAGAVTVATGASWSAMYHVAVNSAPGGGFRTRTTALIAWGLQSEMRPPVGVSWDVAVVRLAPVAKPNSSNDGGRSGVGRRVGTGVGGVAVRRNSTGVCARRASTVRSIGS